MKTPRVSADGGRGRFPAQIVGRWLATEVSVTDVCTPCVRAGCKACAEGQEHCVFILFCKEGARRRCLYVPAERIAAFWAKTDACQAACGTGQRSTCVVVHVGAEAHPLAHGVYVPL